MEEIHSLMRIIEEADLGGDRDTFMDAVGQLFIALLRENKLQNIFDLKALVEIKRIFEKHGISDKFSEDLVRLSDHVDLVKDTHSKLFSVLDANCSIDVLINRVFENWHSANGRQLEFSKGEKSELQAIRVSKTPPSTKLKQFSAKYFRILKDNGIDTAQVEMLFQRAYDVYKQLESRYNSFALFFDHNVKSGLVIGLELDARDVGINNVSIFTMDRVQPNMEKAVKEAIACARKYLKLPNKYEVWWKLEKALPYEGESIGLAVMAGMFSEFGLPRFDCYTAFTGSLDAKSGAVKSVQYVDEKLASASSCGIYRVFIPMDNYSNELQSKFPALQIIGVESVEQVKAYLEKIGIEWKTVKSDSGLTIVIRQFEKKCFESGLRIVESKSLPFGEQLIVTDLRDEVPVNVYHGRRGISHNVQGKKDRPLHKIVQGIAQEIFGRKLVEGPRGRPEIVHYVVREPALREGVRQQLVKVSNMVESEEDNYEYRLDFTAQDEKVIVKQSPSGKLLVIGYPTWPLFEDVRRRVEIVLGIGETPGNSMSLPVSVTNELIGEPAPLPSKLRPQDSPKHDLANASTWIGTDESGKGDYFGPLVSAGVCVDRKLERELRSLGVKDSKKLSDRTTRELAKKIRAMCNGRYAEVPIPPQTYNILYNQFKKEGKTLNTLLAWGHARAIENILGKINCEYALADQFADERFIISKLQEAGRKINLIQRAKAEEDMAVAAASILARDRFLFYLDRMGQEYHIQFPKGASTEVIKVAKEFVARNGKDHLGKVAKLHFCTTKEVLG